MDNQIDSRQQNCIISLENYLTQVINRKYQTEYQDDVKDAKNGYELFCKPIYNDITHGNILQLEYKEIDAVKDELSEIITQMNRFKTDSDKYNYTMDMRKQFKLNKLNEKISPIKRQIYNQLEYDIYPGITKESIIFKKIEDSQKVLKDLNAQFPSYKPLVNEDDDL